MHADEYELGMDQELMMASTPDFPMDEAHLAPRFDSTPWFLTYLKHQRDGDFWRQPLKMLNHEPLGNRIAIEKKSGFSSSRRYRVR